MTTTEQKLKELEELLEQVQTQSDYDYVAEQIEELVMMLYYESLIRSELESD